MASKASASGPAMKRAARKVASTAKPSLPESERLKRLFTSLCAQIDGGHFKNAIKTCDKSKLFPFVRQSQIDTTVVSVLRLKPGDADAVQTKLFLLLQTEQYSVVLSLIGDDTSQYAFQRAYSLYRLQRELDTVELLQSIRAEGKDDRGVLHLQAQIVRPPRL